jgi:hypothetical protein
MKKKQFQASIEVVAFRMDDSDLNNGRIPGNCKSPEDVQTERAFLRQIAQIPSGANQHPENRVAKVIVVREIWSKYSYHGYGSKPLHPTAQKAIDFLLKESPIDERVLIKENGLYYWK